MFRTTTGLPVAAILALTASGAMAANFPIDVADPANGLTGIYSATFDGGLTPCGGGSSPHCAFFNGDPTLARNVTDIPDPTLVVNNVPGGIGPTGVPPAPVPASGSFLDLTLSGGNTLLTLGQSSITFGVVDICITQATFCASVNAHAVDAGVVFNAPQPAIAGARTPAGGGSSGTTTVPVDGNGVAVFEVQNSGAIVLDFSKFSSVVTSCTGSSCFLVTGDILFLDVIRYVLEIDWDPTFTSFTGHLIGQTANNSIIFARLNSAGADDDGDTVLDTADNCPTVSNVAQTNSDTDSRGDACDSCRLVNNTAAGVVAHTGGAYALSQFDSDHDGYGNVCDADINQSGGTTTGDYTLLRNVLSHFDDEGAGTCSGTCVPANIIKADMNGSGQVTTGDYTLLRNRLSTPPGPSGWPCAAVAPTPQSTACPPPPPY